MAFITTESGLQYKDDVVGTGNEVSQRTSHVKVHYTGWLKKEDGAPGEKFDSSRDRDEPFSFPVNVGYVIQGWDEGVMGMKVGGTRTLHLPSALAYGSRGAGDVIPPNADLIFEIELLSA